MSKWKPKEGETYFQPYIMCFEADYIAKVWYGCEIDENYYKAGLARRTKEEALEVSQKMLAVAKEHRE